MSTAPPLKESGLAKGPVPNSIALLVPRPSGPDVIKGMLPDCAFACVPRYMGLRVHRRAADCARFFTQPGYTRPENI